MNLETKYDNKSNNIIEVTLNDRVGKKIRVKCFPQDTIFNLKQLSAAHLGTKPEKLKIQKGYDVYKDNLTLDDYEIKDGMGLELYYN
jgi:ubiquitin-like protein 5